VCLVQHLPLPAHHPGVHVCVAEGVHHEATLRHYPLSLRVRGLHIEIEACAPCTRHELRQAITLQVLQRVVVACVHTHRHTPTSASNWGEEERAWLYMVLRHNPIGGEKRGRGFLGYRLPARYADTLYCLSNGCTSLCMIALSP
jgi:hypothetical protein